MDFTNQINNESEKPHLQYSRQVPNATRNVLTKIFKFKNSSGDTTDSLPAAMADASSNSDLSAAGASDCPSSPRPTHASISDGSEGSDADIEESSRAVSLSPPDSVPDTQGAHVEGSQYPHPGLIFGNHGPPPGLTGANHQAVHQETAENQRPLQNQALGTQGFRRLPPPPGFGTSFGNRRYPSGFRPPVMFEKCFSLASTRIVSQSSSHLMLCTRSCHSQAHSTIIRFIAIDAAAARTLAGSTAAVMTLMPGSSSLYGMATRYVWGCFFDKDSISWEEVPART